MSIVTEDSTMCHTFKFGAPVNSPMTALCNSRAGDRDSHGDDDNCSLCGGNDGTNVYRVFELKVDIKYLVSNASLDWFYSLKLWREDCYCIDISNKSFDLK